MSSDKKTLWKDVLYPVLTTSLSGLVEIALKRLRESQWSVPSPFVLGAGLAIGLTMLLWRRHSKSAQDELPEVIVSKLASANDYRREWPVVGHHPYKVGLWRVVYPPLTFADAYAIGGIYRRRDPEQYDVIAPPLCSKCHTEFDETSKGKKYLWTCPDPDCAATVTSDVSQRKMAEQVARVVRRDAREGRPPGGDTGVASASR